MRSTQQERMAAEALVGQRVRFAHMPDAEENYFAVISAHDGMVELEGWSGYFGIGGFITKAAA
jgi:hypothetical protein